METSPGDRIHAANALFARGEYKGALESYDLLLRQEPENAVLQFNRAVALHRLGELVLAKNPDDHEAVLNLGGLLRDSGESDRAIGLYESALKKDEFNSRILNNLAVLYRGKKQYPKAIKAVRTLLMRDQRNLDAMKNLALVYYDQGKYTLGRTILENALKAAKKANKEDPDISVNIGMIHLAQKENGKAMASFKEAVSLDPKHVVANYNIGALALAHRDYDLAAKSYAVVAAAWPERYSVNVSLGYALQGQQKLEEAAKQLEKARIIKAKEAVALNDEDQIVLQLWQIYQNVDNADKAIQYADEYLRLKSKTCGATDTDEICGRYMGTKLMREMKNQPPPAEEKPKATGVEVFTDAPAEGDVQPGDADAPAPAPAPNAEGQEAPGSSP